MSDGLTGLLPAWWPLPQLRLTPHHYTAAIYAGRRGQANSPPTMTPLPSMLAEGAARARIPALGGRTLGKKWFKSCWLSDTGMAMEAHGLEAGSKKVGGPAVAVAVLGSCSVAEAGGKVVAVGQVQSSCMSSRRATRPGSRACGAVSRAW